VITLHNSQERSDTGRRGRRELLRRSVGAPPAGPSTSPPRPGITKKSTAVSMNGPAGRSCRLSRTCSSPWSISTSPSPGTRTSRSCTLTAVGISARPETASWPRRWSRPSALPQVN